VVVTDTAVASRTDHDVTVSLTPGADYYAVVLDFAGTTTYYEICAQVAQVLPPSTCPGSAPWPAPPKPLSAPLGARMSQPRATASRKVPPAPRRGVAPRVSSLLPLGRQ